MGFNLATAGDSPNSGTVLLAITGMSPAVLTETVWALARETPPVIPQRVVVITTLPGKLRLETDLLQPSSEFGNRPVWQVLRETIFAELSRRGQFSRAAADKLLILEDARLVAQPDVQTGRAFPVEDIRTPVDNEIAADFILDEVRGITANPDTTLIASMAGGRKTMGSLLYAAMSLLGRPRDRLTHVLVSEPFEDPGLAPRFYFPTQPETLHQHPRTGGVHTSDQARVLLADVPFVRLRELFPKQLGRYPGSFNGLVRTYGERIHQLSGPLEISLHDTEMTLEAQGIRVALIPREFALYRFLAERSRDGLPAWAQQKDAVDPFRQWLKRWAAGLAPFSQLRESADAWTSPSDDDFRKQLSSLRTKFKQAGLGLWEAQLLPRRGAFGIQVRWTD